MSLYLVNREERHFGFLFTSLLIHNSEFRSRIFELINHRVKSALLTNNFDIYTEVSIFRDYWYSFGDYKEYNNDIGNKRINFLEKLLTSLIIDKGLIFKDQLFWTGEISNSKVWFPGKWNITKINNLQNEKGYTDKEILRCRWLCNAKPDIMIQSGSEIIFIEVKVESGIGFSDFGYNQIETQNDIINAGKATIDWMSDANINRINLWHEKSEGDLNWKEVMEILSNTKNSTNLGEEMIYRHLENMPKEKKTI